MIRVSLAHYRVKSAFITTQGSMICGYAVFLICAKVTLSMKK